MEDVSDRQVLRIVGTPYDSEKGFAELLTLADRLVIAVLSEQLSFNKSFLDDAKNLFLFILPKEQGDGMVGYQVITSDGRLGTSKTRSIEDFVEGRDDLVVIGLCNDLRGFLAQIPSNSEETLAN